MRAITGDLYGHQDEQKAQESQHNGHGLHAPHAESVSPQGCRSVKPALHVFGQGPKGENAVVPA